jgi:predicted nucleic acid-binding protein
LKTFVIDASVAAKWVLPDAPEPYKQQAVWLVRGWTESQIKLIVPDLFWIEMANLLWNATRRERCTRDVAEAGINSLRKYKLPKYPSLRLLDRAFDKAVTHGRTVYSSLYVTLAVESKGKLVTADEKLANAVSGYFPVTWLGAFSRIIAEGETAQPRRFSPLNAAVL